ncbi:efflux RND transporter periplasmic adaptor subunit [Wukongibacter sp. M2B1]|uniref:efflux RND transporter periplasmic adaptor subunit n=1 Tax=Wukongibacter sp. M2B1 TaxID=3088895 RepID=UPI003D7AAE61
MNKKKLFIIIGILIMGCILVLNLNNSTQVEVFSTKKGLMQDIIEAEGIVELENKSTLYSRISGIVSRVNCNEGDKVDIGENLLEFDMEDLVLAKKIGETDLNTELASFENLKNEVKYEDIKKAELELEQAKIDTKIAEKKYEDSADNLKKMETLYDSNLISEEKLKDVKLEESIAKSNLNSEYKEMEIAEYSLKRLKNSISKDDLKIADLKVEQAKLNLEDINKKLEYAKINSDIKGVVLSKFAEEGELIEEGDKLFEIGDYSSAYIEAYILSDDIFEVQVNNKVIISTDALGEIMGEIYYIAAKAEKYISTLGIEQQRIKVKIKYDNKKHVFKPGYSVDLKIIAKEKADTIYVPQKSIFDIEGEDKVFVVENGKLIIRTVKKGFESEEYVEIIEGLSEGEVIIIDPDNNLEEGIKVRY